jgi:hypothetical protein
VSHYYGRLTRDDRTHTHRQTLCVKKMAIEALSIIVGIFCERISAKKRIEASWISPAMTLLLRALAAVSAE